MLAHFHPYGLPVLAFLFAALRRVEFLGRFDSAGVEFISHKRKHLARAELCRALSHATGALFVVNALVNLVRVARGVL